MIKACYSDPYFARTKSRSMEKLRGVADQVQQLQLAELVDPGSLDVELLYQLHDPKLVDAFLYGEGRRASMQGFDWSAEVRNAVLAIQAGQLCAAALALRHGIAANIAQGFHHATYEFPSGFCTFNGLALVAQQRPDLRVFVLDCDQHGGNGTADFAQRLHNLFNFTIFGDRFGAVENPRSLNRCVCRTEGSFAQYMQYVEEGLQQALSWDADLLIYQAGMDVHQHDPFGSVWMESAMLIERDRFVFDWAHRHGLPVLFVMAGGYQEMAQLVELHVNTFVAAQQVFFPRLSGVG